MRLAHILQRTAIATLILCASSNAVFAQAKVYDCLETASMACFNALTERLVALEDAMTDANALATAKYQRATFLAEGGMLNAAEALAKTIVATQKLSTIRDEALLDVVRAIGPDPEERADRVLALIETSTYYDIARSELVEKLARAGNTETATRLASDRSRSNKPLGIYGLYGLVQALARKNKIDTALRMIDNNSDERNRTDSLRAAAGIFVEEGRLDAARAILPRIDDEYMRVMATADAAVAHAKDGDVTAAAELLQEARRIVLSIQDSREQFATFAVFTQAAVRMKEFELVLAMARDIGINHIDRAKNLRMLADTLVRAKERSRWRAIVAEAVETLENGSSKDTFFKKSHKIFVAPAFVDYRRWRRCRLGCRSDDAHS